MRPCDGIIIIIIYTLNLYLIECCVCRNVVNDVNTRAATLQNHVGTGGGGGVDNTFKITEIQNTLNSVTNDIHTLASKSGVSAASMQVL